MRFFEALRLGIGAVREVYSVFLINDSENGDDHCGCALGTAAYAAGQRMLGRYTNNILDRHCVGANDSKLINHFPFLLANTDEAVRISCLHFTRAMTREEIAAYIEPKELAWEAEQAAKQQVKNQPANNREEVSI